MKYFRIGYCPPNPGPWSKAYQNVRAYNENEIDHAIEYAKAHPQKQIYMKTSYGRRYMEITFDDLLKYKNEIL